MQQLPSTIQGVARVGLAIALLAGVLGCSSSTAAKPETAAARKKSGELDKLMRTRMNKSYSQLMFLVFHSEGDSDFGKIEIESDQLRQAVVQVRGLAMPPVVESDEGRSVYSTYNDILQRDTDRFAEAIAQKNRPEIEGLLTKIGKTCDDCHRFFRVEITDAK